MSSPCFNKKKGVAGIAWYSFLWGAIADQGFVLCTYERRRKKEERKRKEEEAAPLVPEEDRKGKRKKERDYPIVVWGHFLNK